MRMIPASCSKTSSSSGSAGAVFRLPASKASLAFSYSSCSFCTRSWCSFRAFFLSFLSRSGLTRTTPKSSMWVWPYLASVASRSASRVKTAMVVRTSHVMDKSRTSVMRYTSGALPLAGGPSHSKGEGVRGSVASGRGVGGDLRNLVGPVVGRERQRLNVQRNASQALRVGDVDRAATGNLHARRGDAEHVLAILDDGQEAAHGRVRATRHAERTVNAGRVRAVVQLQRLLVPLEHGEAEVVGNGGAGRAELVVLERTENRHVATLGGDVQDLFGGRVADLSPLRAGSLQVGRLGGANLSHVVVAGPDDKRLGGVECQGASPQ